MYNKGKLNLRELDTNNLVLNGTDLTIEDKTDGRIYLTSGQHMNKLFKLMGYRNLNVIRILEEFAGKFITEVGNLSDCKIYVDDNTDSFIVADPRSVQWVNDLLDELRKKGYQILSEKCLDPYYYWDQLIVRNNLGYQYCIYIDLVDGYAQLFLLNVESGVVTGMVEDLQYRFTDASSLSGILSALENNVDLSYNFTKDTKLSVHEAISLLKTLGYVGSKRKTGKAYVEDKSDEIKDEIDVESLVDDYNSKTWLQRRINFSEIDFKKMCELVSFCPDVPLYNVREFYNSNRLETSDSFALQG